MHGCIIYFSTPWVKKNQVEFSYTKLTLLTVMRSVSISAHDLFLLLWEDFKSFLGQGVSDMIKTISKVGHEKPHYMGKRKNAQR